MASSTAPFNGRGQILPADDSSTESSFSPLIPRHSSCRTLSLSSSASFSSSNSSFGSTTMFFQEDTSNNDNSSFTPATPLHSSGQIPFSWEKIPGIPKNKEIPGKKIGLESSANLLPLPPAGNQISSTKKLLNKKAICPANQKKSYSNNVSFQKDPFFAALVECSKGNDDQDNIGNFLKCSRVTRTFTDRLGFISTYTSCKSTCAVSESLVYLPRSAHAQMYTRRSR